jgi:hypothetical protein
VRHRNILLANSARFTLKYRRRAEPRKRPGGRRHNRPLTRLGSPTN